MVNVRFRVLSFCFLAATAPSFAGCGSSVQVKTSAAETGTFAGRATYAHAAPPSPPSGSTATARSGDVVEKARASLDRELARKGYRLAPEGEADMIVRVSASVQTVVDQPTGRAALAGAPAESDTVSTLVVDIVDRGTSQTLLHGSAKKEIHTTRVDAKEVDEAVAEISAPIPERQGPAPH